MKRKLWLIIGILHWILSFFTDTLIITCEIPWVYAVWKVIFLLFVIAFYQVVGYVVHEYRAGNQAVRKVCRLVGIYFLIMMVFLLLTWPGIWRVDEFSILRTARDLHIHYWQGYLTSVYYILCLMMIPVPASVIVFMCLINSFVTGYLIYKLWMYTGKRKAAYLLYIPFLFFPVIDSNLYPMRMSIYAFLELLLLAKICFWFYENRTPRKREIFGVLLLAAVVTCWRSESIYYILLFPVLLAVFFWKRINRKQLVRMIVTYVVLAVVAVGIQKVGEGEGDGYEITAIIRPLTPLVVAAAYAEETDLIADIDKVINCAYIFQGASEGETGIGIFWRWVGEGLIKDGQYTDADYQNMLKAYYTLILRHPKIFLQERWQTYKEATWLLGRITDTEPPSPAINETVRKVVYSILELRSFDDYYTQGIGARIVYNSIPPSVLLFLAALLALWKKKLVYAGSILMVFLKVPLVFLTAPGSLFMYYYSPYLCGWVLLFFAGILLLTRKGIKKNETNSLNGAL